MMADHASASTVTKKCLAAQREFTWEWSEGRR
eukprot:COSAG06_NODE_30787_length_532_cov_1.085450_1_plen_31_part_10